MKKKYQVFVSSTYRDLIEERAAVSQCLLDCGCIPVGMEQFPASGMSQMEYIKKMLNDCDYYILILAGRYGSIDVDGIGFTEKEYDYAKSIGLPVMSFLVKDAGKLPLEKCEQTDEGRSWLENFRKKVCADSLVKMYGSLDELKTGVTNSVYRCIIDFPAVGWVRANSEDKNKPIDQQIANYMEKHTISKAEIDALLDEKIQKIPRGTTIRTEPNEAGGNTVIIG